MDITLNISTTGPKAPKVNKVNNDNQVQNEHNKSRSKKSAAKLQVKNQKSKDPNLKNVSRKNKSSSSKSEDKRNEDKPNIIAQFKDKGFPLFNRFDAPKKLDNKNVVPSSETMFASSGRTFKDLNLHPHTVVNLERIGLTTLTAVQEKTIPVILNGKNAFVRSQTGSGKTLAYAVPIIELLQSINPHITRADGVQAIVVVPTRELALQTYELFFKLIEPFKWIVPGRLCGGEKRTAEKARVRKGLTVLVGTPGRLLDHMQHTQNLRLDRVRCLVLDEADRLLDMGFEKDVNRIVHLIEESKSPSYDPMALMKSTLPKKPRTPTTDDDDIPLKNVNSQRKQVILLSATLTNSVKDLATFTMEDYVYIDPLNAGKDISNLTLSDMNVVVPEAVNQKYIVTDVKAKLVVLSAYIISKALKKRCKMFVFMASRQMVEFHEQLFKKCLLKRPLKEGTVDNIVIDDGDSDNDDSLDVLDVKIYKLHGSMEQKERVEIFQAFRADCKAILLCTDVAARGVDIPEADYVVQYTGPLQDDDYIHRVGRTGRVGKKGEAVLFLSNSELEYVNHLKEKKLNLMEITQESVLKQLMTYMEHTSARSSQMAAETLQRRFEKTILQDQQLYRAACFAYSSWSRFYSSCSVAMKEFFDFKTAHLGHYVTSFALRISPQDVGRFCRTEAGKLVEKRLNKKLSNHQEQQAIASNVDFKQPKRSRTKDLMISEFDSGLEPAKKKKKAK